MMVMFEERLVGLVSFGPAPLAPAHSFLCRELGQRLAPDTFLSLVATLVESGQLELWQLDEEASEYRRLSWLPGELASQYGELLESSSDLNHDPWGIVLRLGVEAESSQPDWQFEVDLQGGRFSFEAPASDEHTVMERMRSAFPGHVFQTTSRAPTADDNVLVAGVIRSE